MGLLETDTENDVLRKHQELCRNLNLDSDSANQAWDSYESIRQNYTLEVNLLCTLIWNLVIKCFSFLGGSTSLVRMCFVCGLSKSVKVFTYCRRSIRNGCSRKWREFNSPSTFVQFKVSFQICGLHIIVNCFSICNCCFARFSFIIELGEPRTEYSLEWLPLKL